MTSNSQRLYTAQYRIAKAAWRVVTYWRLHVPIVQVQYIAKAQHFEWGSAIMYLVAGATERGLCHLKMLVQQRLTPRLMLSKTSHRVHGRIPISGRLELSARVEEMS
jgi:hypothetical protein